MRRMVAALAILAGFSGPLVAAVPDVSDPESVKWQAELDAMCAKAACRTERKVTVNLRSGGDVSWVAPGLPYVLGDGLYLLPGELLFFHVEPKDDKLGSIVFVRAVTAPAAGDPSKLSEKDLKVAQEGQLGNEAAVKQALADLRAGAGLGALIKDAPAGTLIVHYRQIPQDAGMILEIAHNLGSSLKFDATIARFGKDGFRHEHSSTCAVNPALPNLETWPDPLGPVRLENFKLLPRGITGCD